MKKLLLFLSAFLFLTLACSAAGEKTSSKKGESMKISIQVTGGSGSYRLTASLADNSSAEAFYRLLEKNPVTIKMNDYGSFEKVGPLGTSLPRNDSQITTSAGDIILYQGNQITIYYDKNSWNFTRLGKIDGITQDQLKKILGKENITAVFAILP